MTPTKLVNLRATFPGHEFGRGTEERNVQGLRPGARVSVRARDDDGRERGEVVDLYARGAVVALDRGGRRAFVYSEIRMERRGA